jgi:hypothetical protein
VHTKRFLAGASAGVVAVALVGACAQQVKRLEPALELRAAFQQLAAARQAAFTVKVTGSLDDLVAAAKQQEPADESSLRTLLNSSVTVAYDQAGPGADDDRMGLSATVGGVTGTELRVVDQVLYVKAPVNELAKKLGVSTGDIASTRAEVADGSPAFGAFFDGHWVSLDVKDAAGLPGEALLGVPAQSADTAKTLAEVKTSATNLFHGAQITRDAADPAHLVVTSSTTKAYTEMKRLATAVSGSDAKDLADDFGDAPKDRPVVVDLWVDNGKLTALELNLLQFVDGATGRAALRLDMTTGTPIAAPTDATKLDPKALTGLEAGSGAEPGAAPGATEVAEMLGYAAIGQAEEEHGKPADFLRASIADMPLPGITARIVRRGVAEVATHGAKACLTLPSSYGKEPSVKKGGC